MLELIQFIFTLFTNPLLAIGGIVIIGLIIGGLRWSSYRSSSTVPLGAEPEIILRHLLKFDDEDLKQNRSRIISAKQIKRLRNEFVTLLIVFTGIVLVLGLFVVTSSWADMFRWDFGILTFVLLGIMGLCLLLILFFIGVAAFQFWGYIEDLRTKRDIALLVPLVFKEHEGEYMTFKFKTHQYIIIASDPRLSEPLSLSIGFMTGDVWHKVQQLENRSAILYIAPGAGKLLSFELVSTEPNVGRKDVS